MIIDPAKVPGESNYSGETTHVSAVSVKLRRVVTLNHQLVVFKYLGGGILQVEAELWFKNGYMQYLPLAKTP